MKRKRYAGNKRAISNENKTPDALLNDIVLQNIFKYLGYKDLKSVRDVKNSIWLRNSKKAWWARTKVVLGEKQEGLKKLADYLNQSEINSHATNYKLEGFRLGYKSLWEDFGPSIKHLELVNCSFPSIDSFRHLIYKQLPNLRKIVTVRLNLHGLRYEIVEPTKWKSPEFGEQPNLKFLSLHFECYSKSISVMELLSHFPNVQALGFFGDADVYKIISIIREHDPNKLKLNHIDIDSPINEFGNFSRLVLLDPQLSFETIKIRLTHTETDILENALARHAKTLKVLSVAEYNYRQAPIKIIPREPLEALEELTINCKLTSADIFRCAPNLRRISLSPEGAPKFTEMAHSNFEIMRCKELAAQIHKGFLFFRRI